MLEVYDEEGQLLFQTEIRNLQSSINLNLAAGIYLVSVKSGAGVATQKLVMER